ncbi:MAG: ATP-binding protein [Bryobacteraceae bacterium]
MNTLFGRILLWFWSTLAITLVGSAFLSALNANRNPRLVTFQLEEARAAYESGGRPALQAFMDTLGRIYNARGILTDENGRDLLTNQDDFALIRRAGRHPILNLLGDSAPTSRAADDGRYWFFLIVPHAKVGSWFLTPDHLFFFVAAVMLCYWFALHITSPVRALQKAVERFGRGDLSARVGSTRRDELGQLARTFDQMAERTETLLTAERRLLLDISHELRSPLARLGVAVELARSGDDLESHLNRIQKESDRLNSLVGELLQVTRAEGDPSLLLHEPVRLDELLALVVEDAGIETAAHGCRIRYNTREPATLEGDPELLRRALENVIRNAIRYAPRDSDVEVSLETVNGSVVCKVRDYGPGVPEESLQRLFDAFYRVGTDRSRNSGGIGLGLSIARRAIELHRGAIAARNAHPGLEVEMRLPAVSSGRMPAENG